MHRGKHHVILIFLTLGALVAPLSAYGQLLHLSDLVTASDYIVVGRIWRFSSKDGIRSVSLNVSKTIRGRRYPILNVVEVPPDTSGASVWELWGKAIYFLAEYHPNADTSQSADPYELRLLDRSVKIPESVLDESLFRVRGEPILVMVHKDLGRIRIEEHGDEDYVKYSPELDVPCKHNVWTNQPEARLYGAIHSASFECILDAVVEQVADEDRQVRWPYTSVAEAFHGRAWRRNDQLSMTAVLYLMDQLSLDWPVKYGVHGGKDVRAYLSAGGGYCILVGAGYHEFGQNGPAKYCLVDSLGTHFWTRECRIDAPPVLADDGTAALIYSTGKPDDRRRPGPVRIDFISIEGDSLGSVAWHHRVTRPFERHSFFPEQALFLPGAEVFVSTINQSEESLPDRGSEFNRTVLVAVSVSGSEVWRHEIGTFIPKDIQIEEESGRLLLYGDFREAITREPFDEGYLLFSFDGELLEKVVTRHVDFKR